jgi:hypothetical protein
MQGKTAYIRPQVVRPPSLNPTQVGTACTELAFRSKIEYMKCEFSTTTQEEGDFRLDGLRYLGSMLQKNGDINEDISHIIRVG